MSQKKYKVKKPNWEGKAVVCIASGPSLDLRDLAHIKGKCPVIAINDNYQVAPWADVLYACDLKWWRWHKGAPTFEGQKWTQDKQAAAEFDLNYIKGVPGSKLSNDQETISTGQNSGFQAINLAYHFGASRVILTGYDMKFSSSNESHWFGDHPDRIRSNYVNFRKSFNDLSKQNLVEVINCTRDTDLDMFKRCPITEAI